MNNPKIRYITVYSLLLILIMVACVAGLCVGNVDIEPSEVMGILSGGGSDATNTNIIMNIRLPRVLLTFILGGALAVSGFLLQTYFANPIAGPYILGISSSAKMVVALTLIFIVGNTGRSSNLMLILSAFVGALMATSLIILISHVVGNMAYLLSAGIMVGYICSAITDFLVTFADDSDIVNLHSWSQGSFSGADMKVVYYAAVITALSLVFVMSLVKALDALRLGETYARSVGVNVRVVRVLIILLSSLLAACVTAFAGPVSFIGIAVPFLMRESLKTSKPIVLIPASFMAGSVFCMVSDIIARQLFAPAEINISAVTSLFGAPIVIIMIIRRQRDDKA